MTVPAAALHAGFSRGVLVAEHDQESVRLLHALLLEVGDAVQLVSAAQAAIDAVVASPFDLIVIGIELPDMTGLELVRHLREITGTPVIVVAREHETEELVRFLDGGADDYIARPYRPTELAARARAPAPLSPPRCGAGALR